MPGSSSGARERSIVSTARSRDQVDAPLDGAQHAQAEQVDLEEARVGARVLVPLAELAALHGGGHERHELGQRARRDDHPPGVLREVAGEAGDLPAEVRERPEAAVVGALAHAVGLGELLTHALGAVAVGAACEAIEIGRREAQRLAELADGAARAVGRERRDQRAALAPEAVVHRQDQLLPDVAREVEVDVGHCGQFMIEEAAERESCRDRVHVREAGEVAHDRADRRAPAAARWQCHARRVRTAHRDRDLARDLEDLTVQQEEARKAVVADQGELLLEPPPRFAAVAEAAVATLQLERADLCQLGIGHGVVGRRVAVAEVLGEVEAQPLGQLDRLARGLGQVAEQERQLARALEHVLAVAAALGLAGLQREVRANGDHRILERAPPTVVHVHVVRRDRTEPEEARALEQAPVAGAVASPERSLELDAQAAPAEGLVEHPAALQRDSLVAVHERAVARAARQADEPLGALAQRVQRRARARAVLDVRGREQLREIGVARARLGEQRDVEGAVLVGDRQLASGDGPQAERLGGVRELERAAEVVVIGQRERPVAELVRTGDQFLRPRGAVEEGVGRVAVELRVGNRQEGTFHARQGEHRGPIR